MKTLRISDDVHQKLTGLLGELTAQTMKMQTYTAQVEEFINEKKHLGYMTREEFFRDAARWRLKSLSDEYEYVEVRKDVYEKLEYAIKEMDLPFVGASDFIDEQIKSALEKYGEWKEQREEQEKE